MIEDLKFFEAEVAHKFEAGEIRGPVHLSGGNEEQLIKLFANNIKPGDWIFSTWRNHYHALLAGIDPHDLMDKLVSGPSMNVMSREHNFFTSAIVGGICPIAVGVAAAIKLNNEDSHVWCFIGDMAAETGIFMESNRFAEAFDLPVAFVVEENGFSTDTPIKSVCLSEKPVSGPKIMRYKYERTYPHCGIGKWVSF